MKKLLYTLLFLPVVASSQNFHFSGRFGLAGYQGDLKEHSVTLSQSKLFGSVGARYDLSERFTARSYFSYTTLQADDKKGTATMQQRNLNFKTRILDLELTAQYNIFSLNYRWWTPYVFAGVGAFRFNPYTNDAADNRVFLQPLSTEGQGFEPGRSKYSRVQISIPLGFGADYALNEDVRVGLEFGYRKLFTDYLDDVSTTYVDPTNLLAARGATAVDLAWRGDEYNGAPYPESGTIRGNSKNKDAFYYVALTFTFRHYFDKYKMTSGIPGGKRDKRVGCPASRG
ncbi:MAG TPA: DUF6089 family protein [Flavisolibacter sp.]